MLGWDTAGISDPEVPHSSLYSTQTLFILVILVISWRSELLCVVVLQQMNTSLKLGTGEANFMSILNLTELSGSDWPGYPSQSRVLKQSRLEETDFSLQKLSFPPRKSEGEKKKNKRKSKEFSIIISFSISKIFCWLKIQFPLHTKLLG